MSGVVYIKHSNNWIACNFGNVNIYVKDAGVWTIMTPSRIVHVKDADSWKQVYPSLSSSWTDYKTPGTAEAGGFSIPVLSTDPSYLVSNLATASAEVRWEDRDDDINNLGQDALGSDFGWTDDIVGAHFGAIKRMAVTLASRYVGGKLPASQYRAGARSKDAGFVDNFTALLTGSFVTYTLDYVMGLGGWEVIDPDKAGDIVDGAGRIGGSIAYNNATESSDKEASLKEFQVKLQYDHN